MNTAALRGAGIHGANIIVFTIESTPRDALTPTADIAIRAGITVIASYRVIGVGTAQINIALIIRTQVLVIANDGNSPTTGAIGAEFVGSTGVSIVADDRIVEMEATLVEVTEVISADIVVITAQQLARDTHPVLADVILRANAAVVARRLVGDKLAARGRGA